MKNNDLFSNIIENSVDLKNRRATNNSYFVTSDNQGIQFFIPDQHLEGIEKYHNTSLTERHLELLNKKFNKNLSHAKIFVEHADPDYLFGEPYNIVTITL
ncbi:hypothetical protein [Enterococcus hirae]|uniref:hypothetical protein n=1 Tax=Enterococcus hirae TaxID=1354 RepID=UPI00383E63F5